VRSIASVLQIQTSLNLGVLIMKSIVALLIFFLSYSSISQASEYSPHPDGFYYLVKRENGIFYDSYRVLRALKNSQGQFFSASLLQESLQTDEIIGECNPNIESYGWKLIDESIFSFYFMYIVGKTQIDQKEVYCTYSAIAPETTSYRIQTLYDWKDLENDFEIIKESLTLQSGHFKVGSMVKIRTKTWNWKNKIISDATYKQRLSYIYTTKNTPNKVNLFFDGPKIFLDGDRITTNFESFVHNPSKQNKLTYDFKRDREESEVEITPLDSLFKVGETVCYNRNGSLTRGLVQSYTYSGYVVEGTIYQDSDLRKISECKE
jgi:hypothetical protein